MQAALSLPDPTDSPAGNGEYARYAMVVTVIDTILGVIPSNHIVYRDYCVQEIGTAAPMQISPRKTKKRLAKLYIDTNVHGPLPRTSFYQLDLNIRVIIIITEHIFF